MITSHCKTIPHQQPVSISETTDGQVFIIRGNSDDDFCELTIHEWHTLRMDIKAGKFDYLREPYAAGDSVGTQG